MLSRTTTIAAGLVAVASAGSIKDIKHVVLFMQENRGFDHYFGTMPGVRGFADPNVQVNPDGRSTFQQPVTSSQNTNVSQLTPWYFNYLGGEWNDATRCISGGGYSWQAMHESYNQGLSNQWVSQNDPYSLGYFKRQDIPTHFDVADGWTVGDMYTESILAATDPNRITWMSGTVNNPGTPSNPDGQGGMMLDNSATPGCEAPHLNCYPLSWKTVAEYWQGANVSWQVCKKRYAQEPWNLTDTSKDPDNFEDNMLAYFKQYQDASNDTKNPLTKYGNSYPGLQKFYNDAQSGNLPMVSYIIGPGELSEHQPYLPSDGAWLYNQIINAVTSGASAKNTVLLISYDEVGGYMDHVAPYHAPSGTTGEWIQDPYNISGYTPVGPGYRVPFMIVSPWTRGGNVFTEHADHSSQIMFVETWLEALGYENVQSKEIPEWRREHMSNLVNAFDFENPDYSTPTVASAPAPLTTPAAQPTDGLIGALSGNYVGAAKCLADHKTPRPPVPYGSANANQNMTLATEEGFKPLRGALTEGRYLTFEFAGFALTNSNDHISFSKAAAKHDDIRQRFIVRQQGDAGNANNVFTVSSALDGKYVTSTLALSKDAKSAQEFTITHLGGGRGYTAGFGGKSLGMGANQQLQVVQGQPQKGFDIFSVTYHS